MSFLESLERFLGNMKEFLIALVVVISDIVLFPVKQSNSFQNTLKERYRRYRDRKVLRRHEMDRKTLQKSVKLETKERIENVEN